MNCLKLVVAICCLFSFSIASAQLPDLEWVQTTYSIDDFRNSDVAVDHSGNVYTVGSFEETVDFDPGPGVVNVTGVSDNYNDIFIRKLDANGNFLWVKTINAGTQMTELQTIAIDDSGNVLVSGRLRFGNLADLDPGPGISYASATNTAGPFLVKLDANGNFIWGWSVAGGAHPMDVVTDDSCNIYISGEYSGSFPGFPTAVGHDGFIVKFGGGKNIKWRYHLSHPSMGSGGFSDRISSVDVDGGGNVYATGYFYYNNVDFDPGPGTFYMGTTSTKKPFILKLDRNRNFIWAKQLNPTTSQADNVQGNAIAVDDSGNIYTTGCFNGTVDFDPGPGTVNLTGMDGTSNEDVYVHKLRSDGSFAWVRRFSNMYVDGGNDIEVGPSGSVYTVGYFSGTVDFDPGPGVHQETGMNFAPGLPTRGVFIHKMDTGGIFQSMFSYYDGAVYSLDVDQHENLYMTGAAYTVDFDPDSMASVGTGPGYWFFTNKYSNCPSTSSSQTVSACGSYTVNGHTYTSGGTYTQVISNAAGCDSIITLNITITPGPAASITRTACGSYTLNGQTYTTSGTYTQIRPSGGGCDTTLTLNLTIKQPTTSTITQTACSSYTLNGTTYTSSGTYTQLRTNAAGCDSTITLNLTIRQPTTSTLNQTACSSYTLNGTTYTSSGTYTQLRTNAAGCDSTITLNLTINQPTTSTLTQTACSSYTLNGTTYTSSGTYTQLRTNAAGCDSTITLNLTIKQPTTSTLNQTACGSYTLNGTTYTSSGTYTQLRTNAAGCDSTITLNLTIKQPTTSALTQTACGSYTLNGTIYTSSGTYTQLRTNAAGCDSTITLNLTINQPTASTLNQTACGSYTLNGQTYTSSGTYNQLLTNAAGCDSTITLNLTVKQPTSSALSQSVCDSYTLNGQTYTSSGTYTQTLTNAAGCDSTITLNLTVNHPTSATLTQTACDSYSLNGQTYTASGTYTQTLTNASGCDSIITLNLTINTVNAGATVTNETITADQLGAAYQWIDCANGNSIIAGETGQSFTATANGIYAVIVTGGSCSDTSDCFTIASVGIENPETSDMSVYPNPTAGQVTVSLSSGTAGTVEVLDASGSVVRAFAYGSPQFTVDLSELAAGFYYIRLHSATGGIVVKKVIKY